MLSSINLFSLTNPYAAAVDEKTILSKPFFLQILKSLIAFSVLFLKYFSGNFTDSSTCIKPAKCISTSKLFEFKILEIFSSSLILHLVNSASLGINFSSPVDKLSMI